MKYYSKETLLDRYEKLPQELKGAIFAQVNTDNLLKIGRNNNLTFDQIGAMARETGYVILGITHPARFVYKLKESLNIDTARANAVARDINREIFRSIWTNLREVHNIKDAATSDEVVAGKKEGARTPAPQKTETPTAERAINAQPETATQKVAPMVLPQKPPATKKEQTTQEQIPPPTDELFIPILRKVAPPARETPDAEYKKEDAEDGRSEKVQLEQSVVMPEKKLQETVGAETQQTTFAPLPEKSETGEKSVPQERATPEQQTQKDIKMVFPEKFAAKSPPEQKDQSKESPPPPKIDPYRESIE